MLSEPALVEKPAGAVQRPSADAPLGAALPSVAFFLPALNRGGAEIVILRLAQSFKAAGHRVAVITASEAEAGLPPPTGGIDFVPLRAGHNFSSIRPLLRFVRQWRPDVLISALPHTNLAAIVAARLSRHRFAVVVTEHAPIGPQLLAFRSWKYRVLPIAFRLLYPLADAVVAVSDGVARDFARVAPGTRRIRRIYSPIISPSHDEQAAQPITLPWPEDPAVPIVLAAGRLAPEKDFTRLLAAFALLRAKTPARLVILGEGPERPLLEAQAASLGIAADVHMPGFAENPYAFMRRASVVALTSRFEGFGNVLVEAMACGTPIVSTDAPTGPHEITEGGRWGRLVPVGDVVGMAEALLQAIREPPERAALRERAKAFDTDAAVASYRNLIDEVLAQPAAKAARLVPKPSDAPPDPTIDRAAWDHVLASLARAPQGRPLRIAIYFNDLSGGGAERVQITLMTEFIRAGAAVEVVLHSARGDLGRSIPKGVPATAFETRHVSNDLFPLAAYLRRRRPDILLTSLNHNNITAALAGMLAGGRTAVIISQHNALSQEVIHHRSWKYSIVPMAYRAVAPLVDGIVAVSSGVADDMVRASGIRRGRFTVIHNPIVDAGFADRADQPIDHPWFSADAPPVFLTAGRLVPQKDHDTLLRAFALYRGAQSGRLMVLGAGPLLDGLQSLALELGIADSVAFLGFRSNPLPYYRHAAAFVLSSRFEGFGNVLVEAMACGLPVIATDCPHGPAEILDHGTFGSLVPVGDPAALAAAMNPRLRDRFPVEMLQMRAATFAAEPAAAAYLRVMQAALRARGR